MNDGHEDKDKVSDGLDSKQSGAAASNIVDGAVSSNSTAEEDSGPTKEKSGAQQLKSLRLNHKNTVLVAAAILCKDNIKALVMIILELSRPIWTDHSQQARLCRDPFVFFDI